MDIGAQTTVNPQGSQYQKHICLSAAGSRGTGKSTLVHSLRREYSVRRFLVMDPLGDYRQEVDCYATNWRDVDAYFDNQLMVGDDFSLAYCPEDIPEHEAAQRLAKMSLFLRNNTLIIEEAHDALNNSDCPKEIIAHAKRGRHYNAGLWCVSQRPKDISPHLRSEMQSSEAYYLRLAETIDIDYVKERRGKRAAEEIAYLPNFHGIRIMPGVRGWDQFTVSPEPRLSIGQHIHPEAMANVVCPACSHSFAYK